MTDSGTSKVYVAEATPDFVRVKEDDFNDINSDQTFHTLPFPVPEELLFRADSGLLLVLQEAQRRHRQSRSTLQLQQTRQNTGEQQTLKFSSPACRQEASSGLRLLHPSKIGRASCRKECRSRWSPYH